MDTTNEIEAASGGYCDCHAPGATCPHDTVTWHKIDCTGWFVSVVTRKGCRNIAIRVGKVDVDPFRVKVTGEAWIHTDDVVDMAAGLIEAADLADTR
jgi:hypothetical protein